MSKETIAKVLGIVLSAAVALLMVFGYDVGVIQPREAGGGEPLAAAYGDTNFTNVVTSGNLTVGGAADVAGALNYGTSNLYPLGVTSANQKIVCSSTTITGTGTIPHGLATPSYVVASLAGDATGNGAHVSTTNAAATVTVKVWSSALTPAPATTPVAVNWCAVGNP